MGFFDRFRRAPKTHRSRARTRVRLSRGFDAGGSGRLFEGWAPSDQSINDAIRSGLPLLRRRSRDLMQNNDYARRFVRLVATNVVGPGGVRLQARATDPDGTLDVMANQRIEAGWTAWGEHGRCEVTGKLSWAEVQRLAVKTAAQDGEVFARLVRSRRGFRLQLLPADAVPIELNRERHRGLNPIVMGVELDDFGAPIAYYVGRAGQAVASVSHEEYMRIPAGEMVHLFAPEWVGQVRGVPWMHASMGRLNQLAAYEQAEVVAARIGASKMGFYTSEGGEEYQGEAEDDDGEYIEEAEPGLFGRLPPGVGFQAWNPDYPSANFAPFVKRSLQGVASGLGVSYQGLTGDMEGTSFSSGRIGSIAERDEWATMQNWFVGSFCAPIFAEWLPNALETGAVNLPVEKIDKFESVRWQPRRWAWVDPVKDVLAATKSVDANMKTRRQVVEEQGGDWEDTLAQLTRERGQLIAAGLLAAEEPTP